MDILQFEFMQNAILAGILASVICGIIGTLVVVNRIVFISAGTAHSAYGGIGLAFYFGWPIILTTLGFSITTTLVLVLLTKKKKIRSDSVIGVLWSAGMAFGIVLVDLTPGYKPELMSYLFGSILAVPSGELWIMLLADIAIGGVILLFYQDFVAISYDEEFAQVRGVPVNFFYSLLLVMIAISVVILIRIVGLILVIALLTIPPLIVERYLKSLGKMMQWSILLNVILTLSGLALSFFFNLSSGAAIVTIAVVFYGISLGAQKFLPLPA